MNHRCPKCQRDEATPLGGSNMVLRTVYLPKDLDDQLRRLAFDQQTSKNDLIQSAVSTALKVWTRTPDDKQAVAAPPRAPGEDDEQRVDAYLETPFEERYALPPRRAASSDDRALQAALDSQEFYEVMQAYRHSPRTDQQSVVLAFEQVKQFVLARFVTAGAALTGAAPSAPPQEETP